jgi:anti-anti-sigma regulatory factor
MIEPLAPVEVEPIKLTDLASENAEALRAQLLGIGAVGVLDGSVIETADFACLQILCAAFRDADQSGRSLRWSAASLELQTVATRLGLAAVLHLGSELQAQP